MRVVGNKAASCDVGLPVAFFDFFSAGPTAMGKFIFVTFAVLGWTFYEMSGGADFEPEQRAETVAEPVEEVVIAEAPVDAVDQEAEEITVTRASATDLVVVPGATEAEPDPLVAAAVSAATTAPEVVAEPEPQIITDLREVAGEWVNMRSGPSTNYAVLDTLPLGTQAEVIELSQNGWARIRIIETDQIGWMAERLLTRG